MYTQLDWLRDLSTVVEHLSDVSPDEVLGNLKRAGSLARSAREVLKDLGSEVLEDDMTRAVVELARRLAAWRPIVLDTQRLEVAASGSSFDAAIAIATLQTQAAVRTAGALLYLLQQGAVSVSGSDGSTNISRILYACSCVVLGSATGPMQLLQQQLTRGMAAWPDIQLRTAGSILLHQCGWLVSTAGGLLSYIEKAAAHGSQPANSAVMTFWKAANLHSFWAKCVAAVTVCQQLHGLPSGDDALVLLSELVLFGVNCKPVSAFQRLLGEASALILGDSSALKAFLPAVAACHRRQVEALVYIERSQAGPEDSKLQSALGAWVSTSQLLRRHALADTLASCGILRDIAAAAVAAVPTLLRSYLVGGSLAGREEVLEGIIAAACQCGRLVIAALPDPTYRQAGRSASNRLQVAGVVWEGLALACAALQAVLERDVAQQASASASASSRRQSAGQQGSGRAAGAPAAAAGDSNLCGSLVDAMGTVQALLARISLILEGSCETAVALEDVDATAAGLEAALRLGALLWQRADQLRALVGSKAVEHLGNSVAMVMNKGPQAVALAMEGSHSPHFRSVQALQSFLFSLAKAALVAPLSAQSGFQPMAPAGVLNQLRFCLASMQLACNPPKDGFNDRFVKVMWSLLVSNTYIFPAAVCRAAAGEARSAVLVSCAAQLVRLALDMRCNSAWGRGSESRGLEALALGAAREVMVAYFSNAEARDELEELLGVLRWTGYLEPGPISYLVEGGLLEDLINWAAAAATGGKRGTPGKVLYLQRQVLDLVLGAAGVLTSEWKKWHPDSHGTLLVDGKAWDQPALKQYLSALRSNNQQLRSKGFWERKVQAVLLPVMRALTAHVEVPNPEESRLGEAEALKTRPCANPLCINMRGCSEARLRVRRCGGCRAVRYCSRECQRAHFKRHQGDCRQVGQAIDNRE